MKRKEPNFLGVAMIFFAIAVIITVLIFVCGCYSAMNNDEVIAECKKCEEAGMKAVVVHLNFDSYPIIGVRCLPQEDKEK